ncbi:MAG: hypothetical protein KatS3mg092_0891 [Patescibacteria group bacterium]|nr:MAG: hypothetical protein KatS3mg092_0891 [Patescibacteria group bacterium]
MKKNYKKIFISVILITVLLGYFFVYKPVIEIKNKAENLIKKAKELKTDFSKNDISLLKSKLLSFSNDYKDFQKTSEKIYWLKFIPYVADFKNGVEAGDYLIKAGVESINAIEPYADLIGFKKGESSFVEKTAEDRLQTAILTLDKLTEKVDPIAQDIDEAYKRISKINPNNYPGKLGKYNLKEQIKNFQETFDGLASLFVDAKPLIKNLPEILGSKEEKTYLILYQNDKERRATGGFLTFYAVFKIKNGKMSIVTSDDIYSLDKSISNHPKAPPEILTYHKGVSQFYIRDSNLSPDFYQSVKLFESLYEKSSLKVKYDGIIAMDSKILIDMLKIFGDIYVDGVTFSAKTDPRCDCPQAIYTLFDIVDRPVAYVKENRKGIMGNLMYTLFQTALRSSPSKYWGLLTSKMLENLQQKHILIYFVDENLQKAIEQVNFAGRIKEFNGDYIHVNNVNFAGAKSNMFVSEEVNLKISGKSRELTVNFKNPYPHSDCNLERGGLCLNATLRNWIRVYVPKGAKLISFQGSLKKTQVYDDLGKTVFEGYTEVPTQGKATVVIKYDLPEIPKDELMIQKQAGVDNQKWQITVNNKKIFEGILDTDKVIKLK